MNEFMMIFRSAPMNTELSPEQMQASIKMWQDWIGGIAAQGNFMSTERLSPSGKTIKSDGVTTDGPYAEVKEIVGGYLIAKADSLEDAMKLAEGCPILQMGGHVEVREIIKMS